MKQIDEHENFEAGSNQTDNYAEVLNESRRLQAKSVLQNEEAGNLVKRSRSLIDESRRLIAKIRRRLF